MIVQDDVLASKEFVYYGPMLECLSHFLNRADELKKKGDEKGHDATTKLATYAEVRGHTVYRWRAAPKNIRGTTWFYVATFLRINGYGVLELLKANKTSPTVARVLEAIGYKVATLEAIAKEQNWRSHYLAWFIRGVFETEEAKPFNLGDARRKLLWKSYEKLKYETNRRIVEYPQTLGVDLSDKPTEIDSRVEAVPIDETNEGSILAQPASMRLVRSSIFKLASALTNLLDLVVSPGASNTIEINAHEKNILVTLAIQLGTILKILKEKPNAK